MQTKSSIKMNFLLRLYFELKRQYYQLRYSNLSINKGVIIKGSLKISGKVRVEIGPGCRLGKKVGIYGSGQLTVGQNVSLNGPSIGCFHTISIGDDCLISDCYLADSDYHNIEPHLRHHPPSEKVSAPITIERNVWIGARATVMKGVCIGSNSVIGLGTIIRKSVPADVVVIGNPQQVIKHFNIKDEKLKSQIFSEISQ
jgi:acetyltransferase-like isoleucine patch superfamily enzyme